MRQHEILGKKQIVWIASLTAVVVLSALYLCYVLISRGEHLQQVEIQRYLEEISRQTSAKANQRIEFNLNKLKSISESLPFLKEEEVDSYLHTLEEKSDYEWIVLLDENNRVISSTKEGLLYQEFEPEKDCRIVVYPLSYNNWTMVNMIPVKNS